jgi:hypothetical protein
MEARIERMAEGNAWIIADAVKRFDGWVSAGPVAELG